MAKTPESSYAEFEARQARIAEEISRVGIKKVKGIVVVPTSLGAPIDADAIRVSEASKAIKRTTKRRRVRRRTASG